MASWSRFSPLFAVGLAGALAACASTPRVNPQTEEQALRDMHARWIQAVKAKDVATIAQLYAPDAQFVVSNAAAVSGRDAIRASWQEFLDMPNFTLNFEPTSVTISQSGDMASEIGTYQLSFDSPQGRVEDEGRYSTILRKMNGQWQVVSDVSTSTKPLPAPANPTVALVVVDTDQPQMQATSGMQWSNVDVPGFAPGLKMAVIHGDPSSKGDYTLRLRFPANYEFPPHWHPMGEHLTVLQGTFMLAMGTTVNRGDLKTYAPGDFLYLPAKMAHFGGVRGETVIQLHGMGPFEIHLATATP